MLVGTQAERNALLLDVGEKTHSEKRSACPWLTSISYASTEATVAYITTSGRDLSAVDVATFRCTAADPELKSRVATVHSLCTGVRPQWVRCYIIQCMISPPARVAYSRDIPDLRNPVFLLRDILQVEEIRLNDFGVDLCLTCMDIVGCVTAFASS